MMFVDDDDDLIDSSDDEDIICTSRYISSDEDETILPIILKSMCRVPGKAPTDDCDDFEREMASELTKTVQHLAASFTKNKPQSSGSSSNPATKVDDKEEKNKGGGDTEFYDDVYFDSDESDTEAPEAVSQPSRIKRRKTNRQVMSNDELFYDPTLDDQDQAWVDKKRRSYQAKQKRGMKSADRGQGGKSSSLPSLPPSDAVLNCPACFTTLCMDCQRHQIYHNQYRAMFVFNCAVNKMESLKFPSKDQKKKDYFRNKKKKKLQQRQSSSPQDSQENQFENLVPVSGDGGRAEVSQPPGLNEESCTVTFSPTVSDPEANISTACEGDELYHPVTCKICNTKVAVYDKDEVYHFFNVVTSY